MQTRRGRCNPADTRCQLPRHRVQPNDSDLNERREAGRRLNVESSLNNRQRTGPAIDDPASK